MFRSNLITGVHLAVTDKCNANCPMCPRTTNGGPTNPNLKKQEMTLADAKQIFNVDFLQQLDLIYLCGNFGDPMVAKEVIEILEYFRQINPSISLGFHTNASGRTSEWWQKLGKILSKHGDYCKFGIDGLEDTNAIYRRNTYWKKIMMAAENFIEAGGVAHWEFLVFEHNEHQVEKARSMAEEMGFCNFYVKKTSRFFDYKSGENKPFPVFNKSGETVDFLYPPKNENLINPVSNFVAKTLKNSVEPLLNKKIFSPDITDIKTHENFLDEKTNRRTRQAVENSKTLTDNYDSLEEYFSKTKISCMSLKDQSIYINSHGDVYPCCFLGGQISYPERGSDGDNLELLAIDKMGSLAAINAKNDLVQNIINGPWFEAITKMWEPDYEKKSKVKTCSRMCGNHIELVAGEYA